MEIIKLPPFSTSSPWTSRSIPRWPRSTAKSCGPTPRGPRWWRRRIPRPRTATFRSCPKAGGGFLGATGWNMSWEGTLLYPKGMGWIVSPNGLFRPKKRQFQASDGVAEWSLLALGATAWRTPSGGSQGLDDVTKSCGHQSNGNLLGCVPSRLNAMQRLLLWTHDSAFAEKIAEDDSFASWLGVLDITCKKGLRSQRTTVAGTWSCTVACSWPVIAAALPFKWSYQLGSSWSNSMIPSSWLGGEHVVPKFYQLLLIHSCHVQT